MRRRTLSILVFKLTAAQQRVLFTVLGRLDMYNDCADKGLSSDCTAKAEQKRLLKRLGLGSAAKVALGAMSDVAEQLSELQSRLQGARESRASAKMQMEGEAGAKKRPTWGHHVHVEIRNYSIHALTG